MERGSVDTTPIEARLQQIRSSLSLLREIQAVEYEDFVLSAAATNIAEPQFQIAIQASLDIGQKIIANLNAPLPQDYADVFAMLGKIGVLPQDFARRLVPMARFRNILVHRYLEVDLNKVHEYLQHNLGDFETFVAYITQFMQEQEAEEGKIDR